MSEPLVRLEGVTRAYGALKALDGVDLVIARGEWLAVMGPSGSGKARSARAGRARRRDRRARVGGRHRAHR
jgi:ABC-type transporter Mla maintaining outer membrane lipid asymmetry ATPase subunit MlaF